MLDFLRGHRQPVPSWLRRVTVKDVHRGPGPWIQHFLDEAIVYPGSGLDGSPIRQMGGVAHAFLYLDLSVGLAQIKQAIQADGEDQSGLSNLGLLAMAEFDPGPILAESRIHAPQSPTESQHSNYGLWAIFNRRDHEGRFAFMALGGEAIAAISALYPSTPPKGIVLQEHAFDANPWGEWTGPLNAYADEHWSAPPEWLVLGKDRGQFSHHRGRYEPLGEDRAIESTHGSWRVIHKTQTERVRQ